LCQKTVLLNHLAIDAEYRDFAVISVETPEKRSLPALLIPALRSLLLKLDRSGTAEGLTKKALLALGGFVRAMKLKYADIEVSFDLGSEPGTADSGDLEMDLTDLFVALGKAAKNKKTAIVVFIDEVQYIKEDQFSALIMALHKCAQLQLPIAIVGAGLPQLVAQAGKAKSYAERLFEYPQVGALSEDAAKMAITSPAKKSDVEYEKQALNEILIKTQCYPYFLQEWGKHCWQVAQKSPISLEDVNKATELAILDLDTSFFRVRFDRLTPSEKKYIRAMAELGAGPHRSGDIAHILEKEVQAVATIRAKLINKGMIYGPEHGENSFTVPLFDGYLKRVIPNFKSLS
jgi:hypothetical protein